MLTAYGGIDCSFYFDFYFFSFVFYYFKNL